MSEKYVRCDNHCKHPAYTKSEIDNLLNDKANNDNVYTKSEIDTLLSDKADSSNVYVKGDYAVLTGEITIDTADNQFSVNVSYPNGFTKDNCIPISFGAGGVRNLNGYAGLNYGNVDGDPSLALLNGTFGKSISLNDTEISIGLHIGELSSWETKTFPYKVVLMKIA